MDSITITLGEKTYTVKAPLPLATLRDLHIGVTLPFPDDPQEAVRRTFDSAVAVICMALRDDNPEMTPEVIYAMRMTTAQMRQANDAILELSGLIPSTVEPPADQPPGEAPGAA
jgi:hypothetical protein